MTRKSDTAEASASHAQVPSVAPAALEAQLPARSLGKVGPAVDAPAIPLPLEGPPASPSTAEGAKRASRSTGVARAASKSAGEYALQSTLVPLGTSRQRAQCRATRLAGGWEHCTRSESICSGLAGILADQSRPSSATHVSTDSIEPEVKDKASTLT